jgi:hypothetical protein
MYTTINKSTDYFNTKLYTGNGGTLVNTGVGFQPDLVWVKSRTQANSHVWFDAIRTFAGGKEIQSNNTGAEGASGSAGYGYISAVSSDGFTAQAGTTAGDYTNVSSQNYVAWNWLGANGTATNYDGSITSTVSANTTAGFSIVSYTGNSTAGATVGHSLGVKPSMIIIKNRSDGQNWCVYHSSIGATKYLQLNTTSAEIDTTVTFNDTEPTSSVFTLSDGGGHRIANFSGDNYVAYCLAEKKGYSKFGSYTANANADGPFVYTGFKPSFVLAKNIDQAQPWVMIDNKRDTSNEVTKGLNPNASGAETDSSANNGCDFLSNGFKIRAISTGDLNYTSGQAYIYMAFAENPFVTAGTKAAGTAR